MDGTGSGRIVVSDHAVVAVAYLGTHESVTIAAGQDCTATHGNKRFVKYA
jgi:hypothetical protein